jgi:hypothetical protein
VGDQPSDKETNTASGWARHSLRIFGNGVSERERSESPCRSRWDDSALAAIADPQEVWDVDLLDLYEELHGHEAEAPS